MYLNFYPGDPYEAMDPYAIGSYSFDWPAVTTLEALVGFLDSAEEYEAWFIPHIHPLDEPTAVDIYTGFLDELLLRDLWVDTVLAVFLYMEERNTAVLSVLSEGPMEVSLTLTHDLDPAIYNLPLTLRSAVPAAWSAVGIQQGAVFDVVEPVQEGGEMVVIYDVLPNGGVTTLVPDVMGNMAPVVDAGPDRTLYLPDDLCVLDGVVNDDGLPSPPGSVSTLWTVLSGPANVGISDAAAPQTTATFTVAGTYVLELSASDGEKGSADQLTVIVVDGTVPIAFEVRVNTGADDAEESAAGQMYLDSSDLELVFDYYNGPGNQTVGLRFTGVDVPKGAQITSAWVRFQVDETTSDAASLSIRAQDVDDAPAFSMTTGDLSDRAVTGAQASWSPAAWSVVGQSGPAQQTPDLSATLQEVVDRPGWSSGNALVLLLTGSGRRTAESYDADAAAAPLLHVEYSVPGLAEPIRSPFRGKDRSPQPPRR